jgi:hypothetical protein
MDSKKQNEQNDLGDIDQFVAKVNKIGTSSLCVIIPRETVDFSDIKVDDLLKIWFKKKGGDKNDA